MSPTCPAKDWSLFYNFPKFASIYLLILPNVAANRQFSVNGLEKANPGTGAESVMSVMG